MALPGIGREEGPVTALTAPSASDGRRPLPALHAVLNPAQDFAPEYGGGLSNHLPMALQAAFALGADGDRLQALLNRHARMLHPMPAPPPSPSPRLGQLDDFAAWRARLAQQLATAPSDRVLAETLMMLWPGVLAGAFHGLIRTAHAVLAEHAGELAQGLAYWAARYRPLAVAEVAPDDGAAALDWAAWWQALQQVPTPHGALSNFISTRAAQWAAEPAFSAVAGRLDLHADTLPRLARWAADRYARSGHFTVLHLVTACHAVQVLQPWWPDGRLPRAFSVAAAAAALSSGAAATAGATPAPARGWPALAAAACRHDDEHTVKLVHAARDLDRWWPDPAFAAAAEQALTRRG